MAEAPQWRCTECKKPCVRWPSDASCPSCKAFRTLVPYDGGAQEWVSSENRPVRLSEVSRAKVDRIVSATREVNRVLGGGWKIGGAYLVSAPPGAGKSTLLLQEAVDLTNAEVDVASGDEPYKVLYASAEETAPQIASRGDRLGKQEQGLYLYIQNDVLKIEEQIVALDPDVVYVDSIQTMRRGDIDAPVGSVTQVRESAAHLVGICKSRDIVLVIVAHVTKDGDVAGPKTLEHLVDATLEMDVDERTGIRSLRATKNRFGSTDEMGIFRMTEGGLVSVENPSELLLEAHVDGVPGVCIGVVCPKTSRRPLLCEVQVLVGGQLLQREGKRYCKGIAPNVVAQAIAVLERRCGVPLSDRDVYVNIAGGLSLSDPGLDLPLCLALASAALDYELPAAFAAFGEVGLAGEIRSAANGEMRLRAAALMGMEETMGPAFAEPVKLDEEGDAREGHTALRTLADAFEALEWQVQKAKPKKSKSRKRGKVAA